MNTIATDLDGTIYLQSRIIPGVRDSIISAKKNNLDFIFITNNSSETPQTVKNRLEKILSIQIPVRNIVTPLIVLKKYLNNKNENIYVHGSSKLKNYVSNLSVITKNIKDAGIILIGRKDHFTTEEVEIISNAFNDGKNVFALNKDLTFPINEHEFKDGNGAIVKEIENLIGCEIKSFGKPDRFYSSYLNDNFSNIRYVIGDRVDTDILLAKELNAKSFLVKSSIKNYLNEDIADFKFSTFSECISFIIKNF